MKQRHFLALAFGLVMVVWAVGPGGGPIAHQAWAAATDDTAMPVLRFDRTRYDVSDQAILRLWDAAWNRNPDEPEQIDAHLFARLSGDQLTTELIETGPNTGLFVGFAALGPDGLAVEPGDLIAALVTMENQPHSLTAAVVDGGEATGAFSYSIDSRLLPEGMETTPTPNGEPLPVAAIASSEAGVGFMGQDQVLFGPVANFLLADFVERRGAELLAQAELPLPENMDPVQQQTATYHLFRVDPAAFDLADLPYLMELYGITGHYTYSSDDAARLLGLLMEEQIAGNAAGPHSLLQYQGAPTSNEGLATASGPSPNTRDIFSLSWFRQGVAPSNRIRLAEAMTLLDIIDARQTRPQVPLAVIDGGFAGPGDYTGGLAGLNNPDLGTLSFAAVPQCNIDAFGGGPCGPGVAAGRNQLPCSGDNPCPWHGMEMFSISSAEFNNNFLVGGVVSNAGSGAAGSGAHAASPIFIRAGFPYLVPVAAGIARSAAMGAQVINLSSGFPCGLVLLDWCDPGQVGAYIGFLTPILIAHCDLLRAFVPLLGPVPCPELVFTLLAVPVSASILGTAVIGAEIGGVLIVAAAGNRVSITGVGTFGPFEPALVKLVPCVMGDVLCVGELVVTAGQLTRAPTNAFGAGVDIYAPVLPTTATTDTPFGAHFGTDSAGTSGATAFVSGLAAQVRSLNPGLSRAQVKQLIIGAGCHIGDTALIAGGTCTATTSTVAFHPNDVPGGYVDVLETVHRALLGAGSLPAGLAVCRGGWDEATTAADEAGNAIDLTTTDPGDGIHRVTMTGDLSIHLLPTDEDWYRFRLPAGAGGGDARVTLTAAGAFGNLTAQVFRGPAASPSPISSPFAAGVPTLVSGLVAGQDYFVRVSGAGAANDDNCYGGGSLKVELAVSPAADWAEPNDSVGTAELLSAWQHLDWLCSHHMSGNFPPPVTTARCPTVFNDGSGAAKSAVDLWYLDVPAVNVHSATDIDFYRIHLPDFTDPTQGGHADIDPDPTVIEPLFECGETNRDGFVAGNPHIVKVTGRLQVEIVPRANAAGLRPAMGVALGLYRPAATSWFRDDAMGSPASPTLVKIINCPQKDLNLRDLLFSVGEDSVPRAGAFATGGYDVQVSYQLVANRIFPPLSEIFPGLMGPMPCLRRDGGSGFSFFPACVRDSSPVDLLGVHPFDPIDIPECIIDGPGCAEWWSFGWPEVGSEFFLEFEAPPHLQFGLYNENLELIEQAIPLLPRDTAATAARLVLNAGVLEAGHYYLVVSGPPGEFDMTFTPPDVPDPNRLLFLPAIRR